MPDLRVISGDVQVQHSTSTSTSTNTDVQVPSTPSLVISINIVIVFRLMSEARKTLKALLGSVIISKVGFRDNYIIIGKKGLRSGSAIETVGFSV